MGTSIEVEDFLAHYGKKGMKWGQRNKSTPRGSKAKKIKDKILDDLDIPGRPNRRSNTMSKEQKAKENAPLVKVGQALTAAALLTVGGIQLARVYKEVT